MVAGLLVGAAILGWRTFCTLMQVKQMGRLFLSCLAPIDPLLSFGQSRPVTADGPPQLSRQTWRGSRRTFVRLMHDNS